MVDTPNTSPRADELRRRWKQNPDSRVFLQLAEEYRQLGRLEDAAGALEEGLEHRANDVAALVALGRCRLDLGAVEVAVELLERVLTHDPAHLVANKLLVDAYLRRGDEAKSRDRLSFYRLLNDRDPELDHFDYRLSRLVAGERETPGPLLAASQDDAQPAVQPGTQPVMVPVASAPPVEVAAHPFTAAAPGGLGAVVDPEPFGRLSPWQGSMAHVVLDDGPFDLTFLVASSPPTGAPAAPVEPGRVAASQAPPAPPEPSRASVPESESAAVVEPGPDLEAASDVAGPGFDLEAVSDVAKPGLNLESDSDVVVGAVEEAPAAVTEPGPERGLDDLEPVAEEAESEAVAEVPATLAMAEIYEEQGYRAEALGVLQRVLAEDPRNAQARAQLERLGAPAGQAAPVPPLAARSLLGDSAPDGVTGRKIHLLKRYLETIRAGRSRVE